MMPDLMSLIGKGSFSTKSVGLTEVPVLKALLSKLKHSELASTTLKDLGLLFEIKDGKLTTKPFDLKIGDIKMNIGGTTGLDKNIAYVGKVQLPEKLNAGKFSTFDVKIGGTFAKPEVALDLSGTIKNIVDDAKTKVQDEVNKKVDEAKEKAMKAAQIEADKIRAEAKKIGDKLLAEAQIQSDNLIAKTSNPITKKIAEVSAKKIMDEARKKTAELNVKADEEAKQILQKAEGQSYKLD